MSLLLKALKQAESANSADSAATDALADSDLELEPLAGGAAQAREWVEPPGMLFGSSGLTPEARPSRWRVPRLSLVPATALAATVIALGYGVYLYFALQPPAVATQPPPPPASAPGTPAPAQTAPTAPPAAPSPAPTATPAPAAAPEKAAAPAVRPVRRPAPQADTPPAAQPAPLRFQPDAHAGLLAQAYAAYQRGALNDAQRLYTQAVARERSADALLGLAAIASVQNRDADAQRLYREVLDLDPRNATAQGALLDLLGTTDKQAAESRLKTLIARDPSPQLHETLGNLYADQARWSDAQAAYYEAYRGAPENGDYAYNLAVSLDQLGEHSAARPYYEKALASAGAHRFDRAQAEARVQQLKSLP